MRNKTGQDQPPSSPTKAPNTDRCGQAHHPACFLLAHEAAPKRACSPQPPNPSMTESNPFLFFLGSDRRHSEGMEYFLANSITSLTDSSQHWLSSW